MNKDLEQKAMNACCPLLAALACGDSDKHQHLYCDSQFIIEGFLLSNDWVKDFCLGDFNKCKCYPRGED